MDDLINTYFTYSLPDGGANGRMVELDMGCGKGRFTVELAKRHPDRLILANDIIRERLGIVERRAARSGVENLFTLRAVSLPLVSFQLPPQCIDRLHLLCPDPWPKNRHVTHRLVCTDFLCRVPRVLKRGGIFHLSTDYGPYYDEWLKMFANLTDLYEPYPQGNGDMADVKTDFELRWNAQGTAVRHIVFRLK